MLPASVLLRGGVLLPPVREFKRLLPSAAVVRGGVRGGGAAPVFVTPAAAAVNVERITIAAIIDIIGPLRFVVQGVCGGAGGVATLLAAFALSWRARGGV